MNPFNLRGPEFLLFFAGLSAVAVAFIIVHRRLAEDGPSPAIDLADPYLLAYLRGGANEALRVGMVSLLDRGLLVADGAALRWERPDAIRYVRRPIERELLKLFENGRRASDAFSNVPCAGACADYARTLAASGALPDDDVKRTRRMRLAVVVGILVTVAAIKMIVGLARGAPISFLVALAVVAAIAVVAVANPFRTRRGDRLLADARLLFDGLRGRAASLRSRRGDSDVTMLAAVFGIAQLPAGEFPFLSKLFPRASGGDGMHAGTSCSSCGSSSCGSSSCGGGGGGGGCGGCGGS
jgi:uncharacterized protein (TIGR04222 family)